MNWLLTLLRFFSHALLIFVLTLVTQLGGLAWLVALFFKRRLKVFLIAYVSFSSAAVWVAPTVSGRVPLSCVTQGSLKVQSLVYCALNRHYVSPELKAVLVDVAAKTDQAFPGTQTLVLDGSFPFFDGFPMVPHLSHDDGEKVDLAFFYKDNQGYRPGVTRSPIGYFAFEQGETHCRKKPFSLRWDLEFLQPLWRKLELEPNRMRYVMRLLTRDRRVGKIFLEPHLVAKLNLSSSKIRFQGCNAARHDDHIHFQL